MNDYVIVDGELYHYGTRGMKWGVRRYQNPDGTLTEAGKKRYLKTLNSEMESERSKDVKYGVQKVLKKHPELEEVYNRDNLKQARTKLRELDRMESDWYERDNDDPVYDKYVRKAAKAHVDKYGGDFDSALEWYKDDDGDQGDLGSFAMYLNDHYKGGYNGYIEDTIAATQNYRNECRKSVNEFLGRNANAPVKDIYGPNRKKNINLRIEDLFSLVESSEAFWGKYNPDRQNI